MRNGKHGLRSSKRHTERSRAEEVKGYHKIWRGFPYKTIAQSADHMMQDQLSMHSRTRPWRPDWHNEKFEGETLRAEVYGNMGSRRSKNTNGELEEDGRPGKTILRGRAKAAMIYRVSYKRLRVCSRTEAGHHIPA